MASVWKHPKSQYWVGCYTDETGRQRKASTRKTDRSDALIVAEGWEVAVRKAREGRLSEAQARKIVSQILERTGGESIQEKSMRAYSVLWLKDVEAINDGTGTPDRYRSVMELFLASLGNRAELPISEITTRDIQNFVNGRLENGASSKTVKVDCGCLSSCFSTAYRDGHISRNPVVGVKRPKVVSSKKEIFTPEQITTLVTAAEPEWKTAILVGYYTSQRLQDCVQLQKDKIDLKEGIIWFIQGKTKTEVPVAMHDRLKKHLKTVVAKVSGPYICPSLAKKQTGGDHGLSQTFLKLMRSAGIDPKTGAGQGKRKFSALTFHSLRHSFNSHLAARGVSQEMRMKITGHKSEHVNDGYTHLKMDALRKSIALLPSI